MDTSYKTQLNRNGHVIQSGVPSGNLDWESMPTRGYVSRAVVLKTYYADDSDWNDRAWCLNGTIKGVCCDVRTYGKRQRVLRRVPVLQRVQSLHDEDSYIPRETSVNIAGGTLVTEFSPTGPTVTPAENLDGDHVLVMFLENDPAQPAILPFALPHPNSDRRHLEAEGRVRRIRFNGVVLEFDEDGNLSIDATETAKNELDASGEPVSNVGTGGNVLIKTKASGDKLLSMKLDASGEIHIGSDPDAAPTSPIVCGSEWKTMMVSLIDAILALTVGTGVGPSTTPINSTAFQTIKDSINNDDQLSDFTFTKKSLD